MDKVPSPREAPRDSDTPAYQRDWIRPPDDGRQRALTGNQALDPFDISDLLDVFAPTRGDPRKGNIDNEISFEWKRYDTYGQINHAEHLAYDRQGWRPVMHENFPGRFSPPGTSGPVRVKDMILMERPMRLTVQARMEELARANHAMQVHRTNMGATPEGQAPRMQPVVRSSRTDIQIPD